MVGVAKVFGLFLLFYFISAICNAFGDSGALPPVAAAWLPVALTILWITPKLRAVN
jgi:lipopolysaccharide export LptBFGC system permease protein LptF